MQSGSGDHRFRRRRRAAASENAHQVHVEMPELNPHKLVDAPPYSDIYRTSHGFQALRPGTKGKVGTADHGLQVAAAGNGGDDGEDIDTEAEDFIKREHGKFDGEDIDSEAEDFIKREHGKFGHSKWMFICRG